LVHLDHRYTQHSRKLNAQRALWITGGVRKSNGQITVSNQFSKHNPPANRGRKKGTPNKTTTQLKEAILTAAEQAGGDGGLVKYLHEQARMNPGHFMTLLGKVLPMQVAGDKDAPLNSRVTVAWESVTPKVEWESVRPTKYKADEQDN
jgi:hypothetical protein